MKRLIALLTGIMFVGVAATEVHAVTSVRKSTVTASAVLTGTGDVLLSLNLVDIDITSGALGATTTQMHWDGVTLPRQWRIASSAIVIHSTITAGNGGIQIYTDNKAADADGNPQYVGVSSSALGAMLDTADATGGVTQAEQNLSRAALCWRPVDTTTDTLNIQQRDIDGNPDNGNDILFDPAISQAFGQFFFMLDKARMDVAGTVGVPLADGNGQDFVTVKDTRGIHFFPGPSDFSPMTTPDTIYLGANFEKAFAGRSYRGRIRVEGFFE